MFEQLFQQPAVIARHREGPVSKERERFLVHLAGMGMSKDSLLGFASHLLLIATRINVSDEAPITTQAIERAADLWARRQRRRGRSHTRKARQRFVQVASDWLRFLGQLQAAEPSCLVGEEPLRDFMTFMRDERGLSAYTIRNCQKIVMRFLREFQQLNRPFSSVSITDVDTHLEALGTRQWSRTSIAASARGLRAFFRFAAERGSCSIIIAPGIRGPRVYKHEGLPTGPTWTDVERLIQSANGNKILDIRDHAILRLLAIYGFRRQEVSQLRLEDIDWQKDRILVRRQKQRCVQEYPLVPSVGDAILNYLQHARPKSQYREIFLTTRAPIQPISGDGLYDMVHTRLKGLGIHSLRYGPHALRHACATRLMAQGLSLKHIGDHLGHRTASATQIYAKVDLAGLQEVAEFSLGGLL